MTIPRQRHHFLRPSFPRNRRHSPGIVNISGNTYAHNLSRDSSNQRRRTTRHWPGVEGDVPTERLAVLYDCTDLFCHDIHAKFQNLCTTFVSVTGHLLFYDFIRFPQVVRNGQEISCSMFWCSLLNYDVLSCAVGLEFTAFGTWNGSNGNVR